MPETVSIISEEKRPFQVPGGTLQQYIAVTYQTDTVPPRTVYIDPDHDTKEERIAKIQADLKAFREQKPTTLTLP